MVFMINKTIKLIEKKDDKDKIELRYQHTKMEAKHLESMGINYDTAKKIIKDEKKEIESP